MSFASLSRVKDHMAARAGSAAASVSIRPWRRAGLLAWPLAGVLSFAGFSGISAYLLHRHLVVHLLTLDTERTMELVNDAFAAGTADPARAERLLAAVAGLPDVARAVLRAPDGSIVRSFGGHGVAQAEDGKELVAEAAAGRPAFALDPAAQGLVASYVPLFRSGGADHAVVGVLELHRTPDHALALLAGSGRWIAAGTGLGTLLILGGLCGATRRVDAEIRRQAATTLDECLATAAALTTAAGHGLRDPLAAIRSCAEQAVRAPSPERVSALLDEIMARSDQIEAWIRRYLLEVRAEGAPAGASLGTALAAVRAARAAELSRRRIRWEERETAWPAVRLDPETLEQVLNGLVADAIHAMPWGGTIRIGARPAGDDIVELEIAAMGHGPSEERLARASAAPAAGPPGPGLAAIERILEHRNADIALASGTSRGTVVILRLPVAREVGLSRGQ
ncbi:ATP-binding protein [Benzoatithermus flavus]|uniref:histidine kinase n=1 Tax=Benzoatithermus flavus TaxID=3108223 RepID=A0ABU8XRQ7_9PROT